MLDIITSYGFLVVAVGTVVLAVAAGMVGTFSVLLGQSLIGDAVSHSAFPGIVIAFILVQTKDPFVLTAGAVLSGAISFIIIQVINSNSKVSLDSILAIVLSSMFGLGMALMTYIDTADFGKNLNRAGLSSYIFGQAAFTMKKDVYLIIGVSIVSILLMLIFYKELKVFLFDKEYSYSIGFSPKLIHLILLIMTMILIGVGMRIVGAVLISSMLIAPAITGLLWSKRLSFVLLIASIVGAVSAFVGTYLSVSYRGMSTGPSIIVVMSIICLSSLVIAPQGAVRSYLNRRTNMNEINKGGKA